MRKEADMLRGMLRGALIMAIMFWAGSGQARRPLKKPLFRRICSKDQSSSELEHLIFEL
jgi:hypothetical protein